METKIIKIDWDFFPTDNQLNLLSNRAHNLKLTCLESVLTKNGVHFEFLSNKLMRFWRTIEIRDYLNDDPKRMIKDVLRYRAGAKMIDVLFDKKTKIKEVITLEGS